MGFVTQIVCSRCDVVFLPGSPLNVCQCGAPLLVQYDLAHLRDSWTKDSLARDRLASMWRYDAVLPTSRDQAISLGEGWTPSLRAACLGKEIGAENLWIKDEGINPTASFKARGQSCAVTMAKHLNLKHLAIPSAGNAGGALATYASAAGLKATVVMPDDVPQANFLESKAAGANVILIDGLINDCGRYIAENKQVHNWFEVSTLKEPYRIEGKKTMGYEIAEQGGWRLPEAIVYPCGGGVGLIGIWKAFDEMEQLGWIDSRRPKMIAVQAAGCQPIVDAFEKGREAADLWPDARTVASGLRVPKALGDFLVLQAVRESHGIAMAVSDAEMLEAGLQMAQTEGIFPAPEGGACVVAIRRLLESGFLHSDDQIVLLNTGSGLKYGEAYGTRFPRISATNQDKLGGLITPR